MRIKTAANRFIVSPFTKYAGLYQQLISSFSSHEHLGNKIIQYIHTARTFRQFEIVRELADILINLPLEHYRLIGQYYLSWRDCWAGKVQTTVLENIIRKSSAYRTKALMSFAAIEGMKQRPELELFYLNESLKTQPSISEFIDISKGISIVKAKEGFHKTALKDLENLIPLLRYAEPLVYFDTLNSYAVELGEAGRVTEARNVSRIVLASPFIKAYPEWQDTAAGVRGANRSFAVLDPSPGHTAKLYSMPVPERKDTIKQDRPAQVINFQKWMKKMSKEKNGEREEKPRNTSERLVKIMNSITPDLTDDELDQIIEVIDNIKSKKT